MAHLLKLRKLRDCRAVDSMTKLVYFSSLRLPLKSSLVSNSRPSFLSRAWIGSGFKVAEQSAALKVRKLSMELF